MNTKFSTNEVTVLNTTTPTEIFRNDLGAITSQKLFRVKCFGSINYNSAVGIPIIQFELQLNGTLLTWASTIPNTGSPKYYLEQNLICKTSNDQIGTTILLSGDSSCAENYDGADHIQIGNNTIDTSDQSIISIICTLGSANSQFGITNKLVILEELI